MANWTTFHDEVPELADMIRDRFTAHLHHILGTLRRDGAPRLSGTELQFASDDVWLGSMPGAAKAEDLRRDPRFALHAAPIDTKLAVGDAKISGVATEISDEDTRRAVAEVLGRADGELFRLDLDQATLTRVAGDTLHIETWHPGRGVQHVERR